MTSRYWNMLAILGLLGLIALILIWNIWLVSPELQQVPLSIELALLLLPLAFLLRGILYKRVETHAYASFTAIFYAFIGFWFAFTPREEIYGYLILLLSFCLYLGGFKFAKMVGVKLPNGEKKETR
jgi:uncharacterized membrane protein